MSEEFVKKLAEATIKNALMQSKGLVDGIMKSGLPHSEEIDALLGQVTLAKERRQIPWLRRVAQEADDLQFDSREWISANIYRLPKKPAAKTSTVSGPSRDIRLETNPDLELVTTDMGRAAATASKSSPSPAELDIEEAMDIEGTIRQIDEVINPSWADQVNLELPLGQEDMESQPTAAPSTSQEPQPTAAPSTSQQPQPAAVDKPVVQREVTPPPSRAPEAVRRSPRKHSSSRREEHELHRAHVPRRSSPRRDHTRRQRYERRPSPAGRKCAAEKRRVSPGRSADRRRAHEDKKPRGDHPRDLPRPSSYAGAVKRGTRHQEPHTARSVASSSTSSRTGPPARNVCPIPGCGQNLSRNHAFDQHLPGIFNAQRLTEDVTTRRISALKLCAKWILGFPDMEQLLRYVNALHLFQPREIAVSRLALENARAVCELLGLQTPEQFEFAPVNSPGMLVHWKVTLQILSCLEERNRNSLRELFPAIEVVVSEDGPDAFDAHFHLDRTAQRAKRSIEEFPAVCSAVKPEEEFQVRVTGGVAVFCDPATYPSEEQVAICQRQGLVVAIGMHPKHQPTEQDWAAFGRCIKFPNVAALGEVGLDYSIAPSLWSRQHVVLDRALQLLSPNLVLVLHSRCQKDSSDNSAMQLLYQLKGVVPSEQKIHLHCFSGDQEAVDRWTHEFPNVHFGFTAMVRDFSGGNKEALKNLEDRRLLLETDAPFFRLGGRHFSTPAMLGMVASLVGAVRGQDWRDILQLTNANARRLYGVDG